MIFLTFPVVCNYEVEREQEIQTRVVARFVSILIFEMSVSVNHENNKNKPQKSLSRFATQDELIHAPTPMNLFLLFETIKNKGKEKA